MYIITIKKRIKEEKNMANPFIELGLAQPKKKKHVINWDPK